MFIILSGRKREIRKKEYVLGILKHSSTVSPPRHDTTNLMRFHHVPYLSDRFLAKNKEYTGGKYWKLSIDGKLLEKSR